MENRIETNEDGEMSYRGWTILIVPCGSMYTKNPPGMCVCGAPTYAATPPHEGTYVDWAAIWRHHSPTSRALVEYRRNEYKDILLSRHIAGDNDMQSHTIMEAIDAFELSLEEMRKDAWDSYTQEIGRR